MMFMTPTLIATVRGEAGLSGNLSPASWHTATTELSSVRGIWGKPALTMPACALHMTGTNG